jgi:hypothetical protein
VGSSPDVVELVHDFADYCFVVGYYAGLEISLVFALGAHAGTGEIGAAGIGEGAVDDHGFEMDSRAQDALHAAYQIGIPVEISSKGRARLFGVEQPDFYILLSDIREDFEKRDHFPAFIDVKVLQVGGRDPDKSARLTDTPADHSFVYVSISNEINHSK